jgi:hypothetical protein
MMIRRAFCCGSDASSSHAGRSDWNDVVQLCVVIRDGVHDASAFGFSAGSSGFSCFSSLVFRFASGFVCTG